MVLETMETESNEDGVQLGEYRTLNLNDDSYSGENSCDKCCRLFV